MGHALPASGPSAGQNDGVVGTDEKCHRQELSPKPPDSQDNVGSKPQDKNSEPKKYVVTQIHCVFGTMAESHSQ